MLWRGQLPPPGKHWQYTPKDLDEMDARGEIYWSPNGNPRRKIYLDQSDGVPIQDIWLDLRDAHNQNINITGYPTEKNPDLLTRIIRASSNPGDLVLDCFSGSGTTLAVASQLHRKWIGIDNSVEAITTTLRRFATGLKPMGDFVTKRNTEIQKDHVQSPLLWNISEEDSKNEVASEKDFQSIRNFALYVSEAYSGELDTALQMWLEG